MPTSSGFDSPLLQALANMFKLVTISNIFFSMMGLIVIQFLSQIVYYRLFHPLKRFPGPFWASVTRLWQAWHFVRGNELNAQWQAVKKYGPVVRISPTMLLVTDSTLLPTIFHRRDVKGQIYISDYFEMPGALLMKDPTEHAAHRRLIGSTYSLTNVMRMEPLLDKHILKWLSKIKHDFADAHKPLDYPMWGAFLSYDSITDLAFRNPFGCIESGSDVGGLMEQFRLGAIAFGIAGRLYKFFRWLPHTWPGKYLVVRPDQTRGFGVMFNQAKKVLDERTLSLTEGQTVNPQKGDRSYDFLQAFLDTRTPDGDHLTDDAIQTEIFVILGAGPEGVSSTTSAFFAEILARPIIFKRLMAEIKAAAEAGKLSQPVPTYMEVSQNLPFFLACVRETMRVHAFAASQLPRVTTADGPEIVLNGFKIPPGIEVAANPWIIHRDKAIYGEDAEEFRPDRWLGDPEQVRILEKYNLAWGYGSRVCLGKHFAQMMLYKTPISFEASLCRETPATPKAHFVQPHGSTIAWRDVWINLKTREPWAVKNDEKNHLVKSSLERPQVKVTA
ncbi:P450 monooxygenase [Penicillium malachiteum]|uniref:P450 monooxygenase n=1 Tax=Penicillium malachiteum TaxID=1324776 RepID=A0AAD6HB22_9EURO|nr:P450 monooxygenase [Penicillium malachiteum]